MLITHSKPVASHSGRFVLLLPPMQFHLLIYLLILFNRSESNQFSAGQQTTTVALNVSDVSLTKSNSIKSNSTSDNLTSVRKDDSERDDDVTLLSDEEIPDASDTPTILYDGLTNEGSSSETEADDRRSAVGSARPKELQIDKGNNTNQEAYNAHMNQLMASPDSKIQNATLSTVITTATETSFKSDVSEVNEDIGEEIDGAQDETDDLDSAHNTDGNSASSLSSSHLTFEPPQNISQYMDYIEKLFHDLRHQITDLFEPHIPQLIRTSQMVELSSSCSFDMLRMALALRQFEPWALRMIDSSGKVPEGIFEGSFTALGSYDECLSTVFQSSVEGALNQPTAGQNSAEQGKDLTQGKYCLVTLSPFMPPKPPADRVERMFQEEANRRNYTQDHQFSRISPMFYYMKFRIGVCIPSSCDQGDLDSISSAISSSLRLNITIPDCRVKHIGKALTRPQFVGGIIFISAVLVVFLATLLDFFQQQFKSIEKQEMRLLDNHLTAKHHQQRESEIFSSGLNLKEPEKSDHIRIRIKSSQSTYPTVLSPAKPPTNIGYNREIGEIFSWKSFSLLTNFQIYFLEQPTHLGPPSRSPSVEQKVLNINNATMASANGNHGEEKLNHVVANGNDGTPITMVRCLDGIRVLSLCWVIIANSYLTLDPRATKRLVKSREAPRDFLFQLVVQASLAIETFFFLSGLLMSISFYKRLRFPEEKSEIPGVKGEYERNPIRTKTRVSATILRWLHFYMHRYIRMTPPTMLIIAFAMYAYHFGDGPLWFEATQQVHQSCAQNWWRHLLHVANFIDTRQMCFIHYWYIAADMQLFLFAPLVLHALYKWRHFGYMLVSAIGSLSIGIVFYITYERNLPPTLLFYNTDPESRREYGNTIMTKPYTHILPYLVGMLVGLYLTETHAKTSHKIREASQRTIEKDGGRSGLSLTGIGAVFALCIALSELFLPYQWNNSHLPGRLIASTYAALFRFGWSLVLAYIVITCRHERGRSCADTRRSYNCTHCLNVDGLSRTGFARPPVVGPTVIQQCFCANGGNCVNRLLSLRIFTHLSKLSFVAYLIHLPLMSVFIGQTRGLFAFSHTLVIHFATSYLVLTFILSFILVHIIEFPFITLERHLLIRILPLWPHNSELHSCQRQNSHRYDSDTRFSERL